MQATESSAVPTAPAEESPLDFFGSGAVLAPRRARATTPPKGRRTLVIVACAVVVVVVFAAVIISSQAVREEAKGGWSGPVQHVSGRVPNRQGKPEDAFRVTLPQSGWEKETKLRDRLGAVVALQRSGPSAVVAVAARDYGRRNPRAAELLRGAFARLEKCFGETLELDATPVPAEVGGMPAQKIEFKGQAEDATWRGDCYLIGRDGFGYWIFVAGSPDRGAADAALAELRQGGQWFERAPGRGGWSEQPPKLATFTAKGGGFEMRGPAEIWDINDNPKVEDEQAVLFLRGLLPKDDDATLRNQQRARVVAILKTYKNDLKKALEAARSRLEAKRKLENDKYRVEAADLKAEEGYPADIGDRRGRLVELRLVGEDGPKRAILAAAVAHEGRTFVIFCECNWEYRGIWRSDFLELLKTVRL